MVERIDVLIIVIITHKYGFGERKRKTSIFSTILLRQERFSRSFCIAFFPD